MAATDSDQAVEKTSSLSSFEQLGLNEWLVDQCKAVGMEKPTPIQINCIPEILDGGSL